MRYLNEYLSSWTSAHITNDVKFDLFKRLVHMHPQIFDENSSGIIISRYMGDPGAASIIFPLTTDKVIIFSNKTSHVNKMLNKHHSTCDNIKLVKHINKIIYKYSNKCIYGSEHTLRSLKTN